MKNNKLIESWKDLLCLLALIVLGLSILYAIFVIPAQESVCTTGYWKGIESFMKTLTF